MVAVVLLKYRHKIWTTDLSERLGGNSTNFCTSKKVSLCSVIVCMLIILPGIVHTTNGISPSKSTLLYSWSKWPNWISQNSTFSCYKQVFSCIKYNNTSYQDFSAGRGGGLSWLFNQMIIETCILGCLSPPQVSTVGPVITMQLLFQATYT